MREGWARVEDELPEYFALLLLVIDNSPAHSASVGTYHNGQWYELDLWKKGSAPAPFVALHPIDRVTHWQALPFPPCKF